MTTLDPKELASMIAGQLRLYHARWLDLQEAIEYSGIGRHRLIGLAKSGKLKGFQDPDSGSRNWVFDRLSIDQYREFQARRLRKKAIDIFRGV